MCTHIIEVFQRGMMLELNIKCFYFDSASSEPYTSMHVLGILRLSAPEKH